MMTNNKGENFRRSRLSCGRPIPRRGQVKVAIVLGLAHSFASLFSFKMADGRREMIGGGANSMGSRRSTSGRLIPRRGLVKAAIVVGVANSLASLFSSKNMTSSQIPDTERVYRSQHNPPPNTTHSPQPPPYNPTEMADGRREMIGSRANSMGSQRSNSGRLIPRRGQVKAAIVVGVANSLASLFSSRNMGSSQFTR
ncbi:hypothetical protein RHSIM_Rhsim02G0120600 [Rhododendron simsii]|uniref:Uncharacterized protein n=1 Tax=Rhododendron simsii TaxID=118357 RepID=A0A834HFR1_RHOSS|nr:hypothetical protein RHSIM_Rhsim02G0120600 [Rhododendron simsii]